MVQRQASKENAPRKDMRPNEGKEEEKMRFGEGSGVVCFVLFSV